MQFLLLIYIIVLILVSFSAKKGNDGYLTFSFIILGIIAAIHYDFGNDYMNYLYAYDRIISVPFSWDCIIDGEIYREPGWAIMCYVFSHIGGFFGLVAFVSIFENIVYYFFIKNYVPRSYWTLAVFIYLFSTNLYIVNMSMLRQGFVVAAFVALIPLIEKKKPLFPLLILFLLSFVHTSAIFLLPFVFWFFIPKINGKLLAVIYLAVFLTLFLCKDVLNMAFSRLMVVEQFEDYVIAHEERGSAQFGVGFIINCIPFLVALLYLLKTNRADESNITESKFVALACIGSLVMPFASIIQMVVRFGYYFNALSIAVIPITYRSVKTTFIRAILIFILVCSMLYTLWGFSTNSVFSEYYTCYRTIFSLPR